MLLWTVVYLLLQMREIHVGNDEGLINLKQEFIARSNRIDGFVETMEKQSPLNLAVREITQQEAEGILEHFVTTTIWFATEEEREEVRMLVSAFRCERNEKFYRLEFFTSTVETDDLTKNMLYLVCGLWLMLTLSILAVSRTVITRANKAFYELLGELDKFHLDNSKMIALPQTRIREYVQLNQSVKELLERVIRSFTDQKIFLENSSHEMQTPVAVAIAKLELLLEKQQDQPENAAEIASILAILNRLKRLNTRLLLLSKIKNNQFPDVREIDLGKLVDEILVDFRELAEYKKIAVTCEIDEASVCRMNEDLAYILLSNLIKNAITHNEEEGSVAIHVTRDHFSVANTGTEAATQVFDRYRNDSHNRESSGLGLSIAKSICDLYGFSIGYSFEGGMHRFVISF
jgi:signal transduction histidine kinase